MLPLKKALNSSLGKKYLMAGSGLAMVGFVITHLLGNLQLYFPDKGRAFNAYAKGLADFGPLLWVAEIALIGICALHVYLAVMLTLKKQEVRKSRYVHDLQTKGGPSYNTAGSRNMIWTGIVLLGFLFVHVAHFKYGLFSTPDIANAKTIVNGQVSTNLYIRVSDAFQNPLWVVFYVSVMIFLGFHLRHGFWSAFQSLGALNKRLEKPMNVLGKLVGSALFLGFLGIPIYFFAMHLAAQ